MIVADVAFAEPVVAVIVDVVVVLVLLGLVREYRKKNKK